MTRYCLTGERDAGHHPQTVIGTLRLLLAISVYHCVDEREQVRVRRKVEALGHTGQRRIDVNEDGVDLSGETPCQPDSYLGGPDSRSDSYNSNGPRPS